MMRTVLYGLRSGQRPNPRRLRLLLLPKTIASISELDLADPPRPACLLILAHSTDRWLV